MPNDLYDLCGWCVASVVPLPDLPRWSGAPRAPDVVIERGVVPAIDNPVLDVPMIQIAADGRARISIAGVADYLVEEGRRIVIENRLPIESPDVRLFLLGSGFGLLCHQRGVLPVHAAAIEVDGAAVLLAGHSGAGKSTLADAFSRRGYAILTDDVAPLDWSSERVRILPGLRRIRLWADSLHAAGWRSEGLERCRDGLEKFSRPTLHEAPVSALAPRAIIYLRRQSRETGGARFERLRGRNAAEAFRIEVYRRRSLVALVGRGAAMQRIAHGAAQIPQHFALERPLSYEQLNPLIDDIVATVRAAR